MWWQAVDGGYYSHERIIARSDCVGSSADLDRAARGRSRRTENVGAPAGHRGKLQQSPLALFGFAVQLELDSRIGIAGDCPVLPHDAAASEGALAVVVNARISVERAGGGLRSNGRNDVSASDVRIIRLSKGGGRKHGGKRRRSDKGFHRFSPVCARSPARAGIVDISSENRGPIKLAVTKVNSFLVPVLCSLDRLLIGLTTCERARPIAA